MINQIISVDRKKYATGLFWQPIAAGFVARNYARSLARTVNRKLNLYTEYRAMVGLAARRGGVRRGVPSAAAEVMEALAEYTSFLAVFNVGALYYLVAVRNGIIVEDKLFDNADAARAEYVRLAAIPDWGALIAPAAWGMPRSIERMLGDVIANNSRAILRPISRFRARFMSLFLFAAFVFGVTYFFREPIAQMFGPRPQMASIDPVLAAEYKRQIEERNKELDVIYEIERTPEPDPIVLPYDYLPDMYSRAELCYQAIAYVMQPIAGWDQVTAECGETHVSAKFNRTFGTVVDFYNVASELMPGAQIREENENLITVRARLPELETSSSIDERDPQTLVRDVTSQFQLIDEDVETDTVVDTITNGVETASVNVVEIAVSSKMTPMHLMGVFNDFGGVYMTKCVWNPALRTWNYEVIIYAK